MDNNNNKSNESNDNNISNNNDGYILSYNEELGRVLISTKDYEIGYKVIKERPLVVYMNIIELISKVNNELSSSDKELLYDMYHKDLIHNLPKYDECKEFITEASLDMNDTNNRDLSLYLKKYSISIDDVYKLINISIFNAHCFQGSHSVYTESSITDENINRTALFYLGSKVAHSCEPNCSYSSKVVDNDNNDNDCLIYSAIKPIKRGDILSFSYIDQRLPTKMRRAVLLREKDFFCQCSKCSDYDYNSGCICHVNGCKGYKYVIKPTISSEDKWLCQLCSNEDIPIDSLHYGSQLKTSYEGLCHKPGAFDILIKKYTILLNLASKWLAPSNHLIISIYFELSKIYATIANKFSNYDDIALQSRLDAVISHLKAFSLLECANEKCSNGIDCLLNHKPVNFISSYVLWSFMDIISVKNSNNNKFIENLPFFIQRLERYLPFLMLEYGNNDSDILKIKSLYNNQYNNTISIYHKCNNKYCFEKGIKQCNKCNDANVFYCSNQCHSKHQCN